MRIETSLSAEDIQRIHQFLSEESYWARGVPMETVRKAVANSLCFVGRLNDELVAFGRVVTDLTTFGYLKDIFVVAEQRGKGLGKQMVAAMLRHLEQEGVTTLMLATEDAHGLYRQFGFELVGDSPKLMRRKT